MENSHGTEANFLLLAKTTTTTALMSKSDQIFALCFISKAEPIAAHTAPNTEAGHWIMTDKRIIAYWLTSVPSYSPLNCLCMSDTQILNIPGISSSQLREWAFWDALNVHLHFTVKLMLVSMQHLIYAVIFPALKTSLCPLFNHNMYRNDLERGKKGVAIFFTLSYSSDSIIKARPGHTS